MIDAYPTPDPARRDPGLQLPGLEVAEARWSEHGWQASDDSPARILWPPEYPPRRTNGIDLRGEATGVRVDPYSPEETILADAALAVPALDSCRRGHRQRMGRP